MVSATLTGVSAQSSRRSIRQSLATVRSGVSLFASDVLVGLRRASHNALAMLGLAAVVAAVFMSGQSQTRHELEARALGWLMDRANLRSGASSDEIGSDNGVLLAMAEPEAIQRATATNPAELNRQQSAVAFWIARRYNVAPEPISRLVQEAWAVGRRVDMDPTLVLAVMAVESGFNPFAQSHVGAQGLMQVMTRIHQDKYEIFGGQNAAFDPVTNLRVGVQVLQDCIHKAGSTEGGLKHYVGAANLADDGGYGAKVLAEQAYLRQVVAGRKPAFNAPLPQASLVQAEAPNRPIPTPAGALAPAQSASPAASPLATEATPAPQPARRIEQVA